MNILNAHNSALLTLVVALLSPSFAYAAPPTSPPKAERFSEVQPEKFADYISKTALAATLKLVRDRSCSQEGMTGYRSRKPNKTTFVITVSCEPPRGVHRSDKRYSAYREYPLTIVVRGDLIEEVDLQGDGFMYESGRIAFITDIDENYMPEFWLFGDVCECDGGPRGCDCNGGKVVEFKDHELQPWKKSKRLISPRPETKHGT
jgi:hypothetical protein